MGWCGGGTGGVNKQTAECKVDSAAAGPALQRAVRPACLSAGESAPEFRFTFKNPRDDVASVRSPPRPPLAHITYAKSGVAVGTAQNRDRHLIETRESGDRDKTETLTRDKWPLHSRVTQRQTAVTLTDAPTGNSKFHQRTHVCGLWKLRKLEALQRSQQTPHRRVPAGPDSGCQY